MYEIDDTIKAQQFNKLQLHKLEATDAFEILSISLEKGTIFPEHTSPKDTILLMLEGDIVFHINGEDIHLQEQQKLNFPKEKKHWVEAFENSKFLIIR